MLMSALSFAKDLKTVVVTTTPQMHCQGCELKIKNNMRFEKGVKRIETSIPKQTVTIQYDADKTTVDKLLKGFEKFGYSACPVDK
ncbi:MAG: heavy-metal-associated domain-containing protein [Paludibacteraceae bacterium]|nr:heavy-metal-associated domain-containing protein [Paludibacteraceae bacterium]